MEQINRMFDYEALSREYNIAKDTLDLLVKEAQQEFPNDEMMIELHVIRALRWLHKKNHH